LICGGAFGGVRVVEGVAHDFLE